MSFHDPLEGTETSHLIVSYIIRLKMTFLLHPFSQKYILFVTIQVREHEGRF